MHAKCALSALSGLLVLTGGCMHSPAENPQARKPAFTEHHSVTGANTTAPATPARPSAARSHDMLNLMVRDLAQRLGTPASSIQVLAIQPVVWDDSSLGCAQPGNSYLQAQTPGVRVLFSYQNKTYQYHGAESGNFLYCEHPAVSGFDEK
jgi:hypothetical protein